MSYKPDPIPNNPEDLAKFLLRELARISSAIDSTPTLPVLNVAPDKPRSGLIVYADGTNWNPGSGEGIYAYYGAAWHFLG